ncbi:hypothetical protein B9Z19DRAFT_658935 [Tuber borchii]|uniref:Uncharacterized protein n=1 Tax=Tuber borchii TaxID=42251 RepID=A0A2T7A011_TUBBO|nr:hypothetical protein B9Z19DRAFT_658935 [Tuber borchii]
MCFFTVRCVSGFFSGLLDGEIYLLAYYIFFHFSLRLDPIGIALLFFSFVLSICPNSKSSLHICSFFHLPFISFSPFPL